LGLLQAEVNVTGDVMNTNVLALAMTDNMMAVGAGSNISVYAVTTLLNWSEEVGSLATPSV
jgi:hypothetical protein